MPPVQPMLAKSVSGVPDPAKHGGLSFEPKWDGFRCLVFKDGDEVELASRNTKPLTRYFPEVVEACRTQLPERIVLDGEIFVGLQGNDGWRLEFETLQERIHPAASRVDKLSVETPAGFVAFDLLALGDTSYVDLPFAERRAALVEALAHLDGAGPCFLTRTTEDPAEAERWFEEFEGAGLDGVVAKPLGAAYEPNKRTMLKIKHERTADVVLAGYREHKTSTPEQPLIGSLLLGLHDEDGELQHIGVSRQLHRGEAGRAVAGAPAAGVRHRGPPVGQVERVPHGQPRPRPRHPEPVERGQGPRLHAAAPRAGAGGEVRPHGGSALPPHRALQAVAARPRSRELRLRPARRAGGLRPH